MALSPFHQVLFALSLGLCVFVVLPRLFGGAEVGRAARESPGRLPPFRRGKDNIGSGHQNLGHQEGKTYENMQHVRNALEENMKNERTKGNRKGLTFTLMPLYAIGVGVFAAYKFVKIKSKEEESASRKAKNEDDIKTKETEHQLLELEQRLAQTEMMLNSLLSQLDPLSNCVNVLANDQRDEIMTQLQSIRQLMKESAINKSELNHDDS
ncbi:coiled-coil domain-containing protein 107 [Microcaecilia unicolor]|uniref:Coiled-coil domain-containing protein 107-like n=1 Tax=Microcaecilia unicolor TaxID=1415580 RepID=A0A6P7Z5C3_9AMPH|nr:coiled-coil domain-containing protein 107-like [Microcaecilia unicolor]